MIRAAHATKKQKGQSVLDWLAENAVADDSLPTDFSYQHDHYLYGTPKKAATAMSTKADVIQPGHVSGLRFVALEGLPRCEPNVSDAVVMKAGETLVVLYGAQAPGWPNAETWAVVRLDDCGAFMGGGTNDEAFQNHRLAGAGMRMYAIQEVVGST
jgi:hypothetical protein